MSIAKTLPAKYYTDPEIFRAEMHPAIAANPLLTFTTVFMLELLSPVRLHPMSYLLVGAALCLFYLLLLALAEHVGMVRAYAVATMATVASSSDIHSGALRTRTPGTAVAASTGSNAIAETRPPIVAGPIARALSAASAFSPREPSTGADFASAVAGSFAGDAHSSAGTRKRTAT
jgi:hypothetical protein